MHVPRGRWSLPDWNMRRGDCGSAIVQLARGRPFFVDIIRDGIALYELQGHELEPPKPLSADAQREEARRYFEGWFESAKRFFVNAQDNIERGWTKEAVFILPFDRLLDMMRTAINVSTNLVNAIVMARWTGEIDADVYAAGGRSGA